MIGHGSAVNQLKISPRKPWLLASASKDRSVRLWNVETMVCIATFHGEEAHRDEVVSIDFNHDCSRLVSSGNDHMIAIWDLTLPEIVSTIEQSKRYNPNTSRRAVKTVYQPFPSFSSRDVHRNYIDCVQWHGDMILSKVIKCRFSMTLFASHSHSNSVFRSHFKQNQNESFSRSTMTCIVGYRSCSHAIRKRLKRWMATASSPNLMSKIANTISFGSPCRMTLRSLHWAIRRARFVCGI